MAAIIAMEYRRFDRSALEGLFVDDPFSLLRLPFRSRSQKLPLASVQLTQSVCRPLACCAEFHVKVALEPLAFSTWCGAVVVARGGPPMSTPNLNACGPPVLPVALTVTATEPLMVAFANGLTIFTLSLSGCTVIVRVGGLGSLSP